MLKMISEVQIVPVKADNGLIGFASFVLYETIYCGSVGIFSRPSGGYRLVYPTRKVMGRDIDVYYPISRQVGLTIEQAVAVKFEEVVSNENGRYGFNNARLA